MKIIRLTLVNFAAIYAGMGKTSITLDLMNVKEHINLFMGPNGSGKSSVLRCAHPFAYNNSISVNINNADMILENQDGKKIIDIQDNDDIYHIQHLYTRKKDGSLTVKSFIELNGEELNESGTSNSFKAVVLNKLGIDETFLTLLSIGNSITGFVDFSSADRKVFITKIFSELGVYNSYYKNVTVLAKSKKSLLNNVIDKLSKFNGVSKQDLVERFNDVSKNLKSLNYNKSQLLQNIGGIQNQLNNYTLFIKDYNDIQYIISETLDKLTSLKKTMNNPCNHDDKVLYNMNRQSMDLTIKVSNVQTEYNNIEKGFNDKQNLLNDLYNRKSGLENKLSKVEIGENITELAQLSARLSMEINEIENDLVDLPKDWKKEDFIKANIYLDELFRLCNKLIYNIDTVSIVSDLHKSYRENRESLFNRINKKYNAISSEIKNFNIINNNRILMDTIENSNCDKDCPFKNFYNTYLQLISRTNMENKHELDRKCEVADLFRDSLSAISVFDEIYGYVNKNANVFKILPKEIFNVDEFINLYLSDRIIYDSLKMSKYITTLENRDKLNDLKNQFNNNNQMIKFYDTNKGIVTELNDELIDVNSKIEKTNGEILFSRNKMLNMDNDIKSLSNDISILNHDIDIMETLLEYQDLIDTNSNKLRDMDDTITQINNLNSKLNDYNIKYKDTESKIGEFEIIKEQLSSSITHLDELEREEAELVESYDEVVEIKRALSPTTGIPVEFIEYYFKHEMVDNMNILLDSVFHGTLRISGERIIINDKEFTIPYIKNNTIVKDISRASDGEKAILTFAFSLVLMQASLDRYNIMLLDEPDTALDYKKRGNFVDLIDTFMRKIGSEQLFLISHNNMFDSYPVNVILTAEMNISNMENASCIELYR